MVGPPVDITSSRALSYLRWLAPISPTTEVQATSRKFDHWIDVVLDGVDRSCAMEQWCSDAVVQWRSGAVVQWRSGAVAQWRCCAMVQCKVQSKVKAVLI